MVTRVKRGLWAGLLFATSVAMQPALAADSTADEPAPRAAPELRKLPGGAWLRVTPDARFKLGRPIQLQLGTTRAKTPTQTLHLLSGRVEVEIPNPNAKVAATAVLIHAPHRVSAVAKGGRSVVIATADHITVAAIQGDMLAASGNEWRTLPSGIVREYIGAGGALADHNVIAAPEAKLSTPIALSVEGGAAEVGAVAVPVPHASGYDFGVWRVEGGERRLVRRITAQGGAAQIPGLPPGSYSVSARAIEASGLEGPDSAPVGLRVVGAELPDGGKVVAGGILLRPQQRVRLLGTAGIEISYGKASHFVPAPNSIGVIRGQPTLIRLRAVGSTLELPLLLEPSTVHASIEIGPKRARWPRDKVLVSIRLTDRVGRPLASDVVIKPRVHVNVTPVALEWKRSDSLLRAMVPRPAEPGPWVVRVEVQDDSGAVIGRDFLEVAGEPSAPEVTASIY